MPNLTTEHKLVKPVPDAHPIPGHDLVIFRKRGEGFHFHSVLAPDQKLGATDRLFLGSRLVAYAVTRDQNLRHRFTVQELRSAEQVGPFSLSFTLSLSVADAREVVEGLDRDPLQRLQDEAGEVVSGIAKRMSWEEIARPAGEVEDRLLDAETRDETGRLMRCLDRLRAFAFGLGLDLRGAQIERVLPSEFGEEYRVAQEEERQRKILAERHRTEQQRQEHQGHLEEASAWKAQTLDNIGRLGKITESASANLAKILDQISDKIDTAPALRGVLQELLGMRQEILALSAAPGAGRGDGSELKLVGGTAGPPLLGNGGGYGMSAFVSRALSTIEGLGCEPVDRYRLTSLALHLLGELALREDADPAVVDRCIRGLGEQARKIIRSVRSPEEHALLLQLQDPEAVRAAVA